MGEREGPFLERDQRVLQDLKAIRHDTDFGSGAPRVTVLADVANGRIVSYVTLSAVQIERAWLPKAHQRNRPDPVPVTLLGQLAVDRHDQRQGRGHSFYSPCGLRLRHQC